MGDLDGKTVGILATHMVEEAELVDVRRYLADAGAAVLDDRHDLYGEQILALYLKMYRAQPGWNDFLRDHNVTCVLMPRNAAISAMLSQTPGWKAVYSDDLAIMFVRK